MPKSHAGGENPSLIQQVFTCKHLSGLGGDGSLGQLLHLCVIQFAPSWWHNIQICAEWAGLPLVRLQWSWYLSKINPCYNCPFRAKWIELIPYYTWGLKYHEIQSWRSQGLWPSWHFSGSSPADLSFKWKANSDKITPWEALVSLIPVVVYPLLHCVPGVIWGENSRALFSSHVF